MELILQVSPGLSPPVHWERATNAAERLLAHVGKPSAEVSVLLTDDAGIRALNRDWRGIDKATDVLSWPLEEGANPSGEELLGDVAISLDTAARQAETRGWTLDDEVALLLIHGILHLLGHEDESDEGAEEMKRLETLLLGKPLDKNPLPPIDGVEFEVQ